MCQPVEELTQVISAGNNKTIGEKQEAVLYRNALPLTRIFKKFSRKRVLGVAGTDFAEEVGITGNIEDGGNGE